MFLFLLQMKLNLPEYNFTFREANGKTEILDVFRNQYVVLTPEEWVRQHFLRFLVEEKGFPASLIAVEKGLVVNGKPRRFDAVAYNKNGLPLVLMEFKSANVPINQNVFEQISVYNQLLRVKYLIVSNGLKHYCCKIDFDKNTIHFLKDIPDFSEVNIDVV